MPNNSSSILFILPVRPHPKRQARKRPRWIIEWESTVSLDDVIALRLALFLFRSHFIIIIIIFINTKIDIRYNCDTFNVF